MISIVKYMTEMLDYEEMSDEEAKKNLQKLRKMYKPPGAAPYQGTGTTKKILKKTIQPEDRPQTGTGQKILKKGIQTMTGQE